MALSCVVAPRAPTGAAPGKRLTRAPAWGTTNTRRARATTSTDGAYCVTRTPYAGIIQSGPPFMARGWQSSPARSVSDLGLIYCAGGRAAHNSPIFRSIAPLCASKSANSVLALPPCSLRSPKSDRLLADFSDRREDGGKAKGLLALASRCLYRSTCVAGKAKRIRRPSTRVGENRRFASTAVRAVNIPEPPAPLPIALYHEVNTSALNHTKPGRRS
jgi:hypothetical protein